ncbi:hypothetical protein Tco_0078073 [Tanacetum coccineum]
MNPIAAQQVALDNALVAPEKRLKIEKCNARIEFSKPQREDTYQITLDALKLSPCYPAILITAEVPEIQMHTEMVPFIKDLGYTGKCDMLYEIHTTICTTPGEHLLLSSIGLDRLRPSRAQILWGIFNQKNVDYVALLWEDFMFQANNREISSAPKTAKKPSTMQTAGVVIRDTPGVSMSKKKAPTKVDRGKGMDLLSNVALLEAAQLKKALKKSKQHTHMLHASGSGDGVASQLKVPDELQDKTTGTGKGTGTIPGVPDVPKDQSKSENESWGDSGNDDSIHDDSDDVSNDDDNDVDSDADGDNDASDSERTNSDEDKNLTHNQKDDEEEEYEEEYVHTPENYGFTDDEKENVDEEEYEELFKDVNSYEQVEDDAHVTLTAAHVTQKTEADTEINSMMNIYVCHEEPSTQTHPLLTIPVTVIPKTSTAVAPVEKKRYIDLIEKLVKDIIKDEVKTQLPQILPKEVSNFATPVIQSTISESLENVVLTKSSSQPQSTYDVAASLTKFELKKILLNKMQKSKSYRDREDKDKDEDPSAGSGQGLKRRKISVDAEPSKGSKSKESKSSSSKGTKSQPKSSGKSAQAEELMFEVTDTEMPHNQVSDLGNTNDQPNIEAALKHDWFKKPERPLTSDPDWNARKSVDFRPPQT